MRQRSSPQHTQSHGARRSLPIESLAKIGSSNCQVHPPGPLRPGSASLTMLASTRASRSSNPPWIPAILPLQIPTDNGHAPQGREAQPLQSALLRIGPAFPATLRQAHSLATAKLHSRQSALLVLPDNSCLLLRAETPTRPPGLSILAFHARELSQVRRASNSWPCLHGYGESRGHLLGGGLQMVRQPREMTEGRGRGQTVHRN
jgi:hypothetical protein